MNIKFRNKLVLWGPVLLAFLILAILYLQQKPEAIVLKLTHNGSERHAFQNGFVAFKEIVEAESNGAIQVQIFPSEQLGNEEHVSEMIKLGAIAGAAQSTAGGLSPFAPEADIFNLPFLFKDMDHFYGVLDGPVGDDVAAIVEEKLDALVLGYWFSGVRHAWNKEKAVLTPDDFKGLKIRVMGSPLFVDTFNTLGSQATPMAFGDVYYGLKQGVIDGAETDFVDLYNKQFHEVTKHVSLTGHNYQAAAFVFSRKLFNSLTPAQQELVIKAGKASVEVQRHAMEKMETEAYDKLVELGIQFHPIDTELFRNQVKSVYAKHVDRVGGPDLVAKILNE